MLRRNYLSLLLLSSCLFYSNNVLGQCAKIDSLLRMIRFSKTEEGKIDALNELVEVYAADKNKNSESKANFYATQALKLAQKAKYRRGIANATTNIAMLDYENMEKVAKSLDNYNQALSIYEDMNDKENIIRMLNVIGTYYYKSKGGDFQQQSLNYFERMLRMLEKQKDTLRIAEANEKIGEIYFNLKEDDKAIFFFKRALKLRKGEKLQNQNNERILARYERIKLMETRIRNTDIFSISVIFSIVIVILLGVIIYSLAQRNRAISLLKRHNLSASS